MKSDRMNDELLADISRALDEKFYREQDTALLEYLRSQADEEQRRARIAEVTHIDDVAVLDNLIDAGVTAESFVALSLYPLVRVAWADGQISDSERVAVLRAAADEGISIDSANYRLLQGWLEDCPDSALQSAWQNYARALARKLDAKHVEAVQHSTLRRARQVADAAGGFLGLGNRISKNEELALLDLARAFQKPADLQ
jgi:uncharacterized tellurite resistance protein B-like protein